VTSTPGQDDEDDEEDTAPGDGNADSDDDDPDPVEESRALVAILEEKGFVRGQNLQYFEDPWGSHNEISWGGRMGMVLTFLFGKEDSED